MSSEWVGSSGGLSYTACQGTSSKLPGPLVDRLRESFHSLRDEAEEEAVDRTATDDFTDDAMDIALLENLPPDYDHDNPGFEPDHQRHSLPHRASSDHRQHNHQISVSSGNLSDLGHFTEQSVLRVISDRYHTDHIFTKCGDVLISVNPFKELDIFGSEHHDKYSLEALVDTADLEPHVFGVACQAASRRQRTKCDQVVLVTGESGAGKTEATKLMLRHILHLAPSRQDGLYHSIQLVNPLIELFGNSRTILNENSSRFAKLLEVRFSQDGSVSGAFIRDYILEKSRVVTQARGESNFHIFYTFLDDVMSDETRQKQFLMQGMDKMHDFRIVPADSWQRNSSRMSPTDKACVLKQIAMTDEEIENMHTILAAILHLANVEFVEDEGSSGDVVVSNEQLTMTKAAALLSVDAKELAQTLVSTQKTFKGEVIRTLQSLSKAKETRDAVAKALYQRLFGWLVRHVNLGLNRQHSSEAGIAFLDICGFEDLGRNSLEQICINLANEHLQQFMNRQVFQHEMRVYRQEGIDIGQVEPPSNQSVLHMFEQPKTGILALIDEDTRLAIATDCSLVKKMGEKHERSQLFKCHEHDRLQFTISHFAGPVGYNGDQFLEKNGDCVTKEVIGMMVESENELVSDLFQVAIAPTGSIAPTRYGYRNSRRHPVNYSPQSDGVNLSASVLQDLRQSLKKRYGTIPRAEIMERTRMSDQRTVIDCFRASMKELLEKMKNSQPFFVRCIKPNDRQAPSMLTDGKVLQQLCYNGITEMASIRRVWFPVRMALTDLTATYGLLVPGAESIKETVKAVEFILENLKIDSDHYRIGKSMVFLKEQLAIRLDRELHRKEEEERKRKEEEDKQKIRKEKKEREAKEKEQRRRERESAVPTILLSTSTSNTIPNGPSSTPGVTSQLKQLFGDLETVMEVATPKSSYKSDATSYKLRESKASRTSSKLTSSLSTSITDDDDDDDHDDDGDDGDDGDGGAGEGGNDGGNQDNNGDDDSQKRYWDIFRIVPREQPVTDIHHMQAMKVIKVIVYILLFLIILSTATAHKVSLMMVLSSMRYRIDGDTEKQTVYYVLMLVAICLPYMLTCMSSAAKIAFGGFRKPSVGTWMWVILMETLHTFGLTLLVFRILPKLDILRGLLLLCAVGSIPAVLKPITAVEARKNSSSKCWERTRAFLDGVLDLLALVGQLSVFPVMYLLDYIPQWREGEIWDVLDAAGAMLFVSCSYWENFMDGRLFVELKASNALKNFMLKRRFDLDRGRHIPQFVTSAWKVLLTSVLAVVYKGGKIFDNQKYLDSLGIFLEDWKAITAIAVLITSGFVCFYFSYIACKLWMQKISFDIPLTLATPCAVLVFFLDSRENFLQVVTNRGSSNAQDNLRWPSDLKTDWEQLACGLGWVVSLLFLCRHVWFPRQTRMAKYEMLFINPMYCGILLAESLLLNRRRHNLACRKRRKAGTTHSTVYYELDKHETRNENNTDYVDDTYAVIRDEESGYSGQSMEMTEEDPYAHNPYAGTKAKPGKEEVPMVYACATMWHEVRREMVALLKSLHRIDLEQWTRKQAQAMSKTRDKDYFEYEAHIFFDDAMTLDDDEDFVPNDYVKMMVEVMEEAVSSVYKKTMTVQDPIKIPTPYGGQLLWIMPGDNMLFVHLKDKAKIRHRKRWSQVMYMYYLLGFRLTRQCQQQIIDNLKAGRSDTQRGATSRTREEVSDSVIFEMLDDSIVKKSQNTFVMALDGDTDFYPGAVHILLDRMKKNPKVGAACGRIHPIGSGPLVWYQMFEYAIGHWMQKATEHVLGCVLCSPGCFSLFRGSALMDDNVMRMYTILPTEPGHYLQYDQGEDRWLCTLLLQQGYRVDYAAAADAWTYAPEGFNEFFNQRRRWMPSTLANVMDLLADYSNTVAVNSNISMLYIIYQVALMVATIVGPGTVLMMIAGAIGVVFNVSLIWSYVIALVPAIVFLFICLYCETHVQLYVAGLLSTFYAFVMMIVFVGTLVTAVVESIFHPSVLVIAFLVIIFLVAGICHPLEFYCLPSGALYLLCIPSGYLLLVIYSLCNLHVVSWGTREAPRKKTKAEQEQEKLEAEKQAAEKAKKKGLLSRFFFSSYLQDLKEIIQSTVGSQKPKEQAEDQSLVLLKQINENLVKMTGAKNSDTETSGSGISGGTKVEVKVGLPEGTQPISEETKTKKKKVKKSVQIVQEPEKTRIVRDDLENPKWAEDQALGKGEVMKLFDEELEFWKNFISRYLKPLDADKEKEKELTKSLLELRNSVCFAVGMVNLLWIAVNFMFQYTTPVQVENPLDPGNKIGIMGLLFVMFLLTILLLQIVGMIVHRWGTLLHLLSFTDISCPCLSQRAETVRDQNEMNFKRAFEFCQRMRDEPLPDYMDDDGPPPGLGSTVRDRLMELPIRKKEFQKEAPQGDSSANRHDSPLTGKGKRSVVGGHETLQRESVVQHLRSTGIIRTDFMKSRKVDMYMRGTAADEDEDAQQFVNRFRSTIHGRGDTTLNGHPWQYSTAGGGHSQTSRNDYPPAIPRRYSGGRQGAAGFRHRVNANHLRQTARNTIQRLERDRFPVSSTRHTYQDRVVADGGCIRGEDGAAVEESERRGDWGFLQGGGVMDRAFSRRMRAFTEYSPEPVDTMPPYGTSQVYHL